MSLESFVNLQLSIMLPPEAEAAADILKVAHSSWEEVSPEFYDAEILPRLVDYLRQRSITLVAKLDGKITAAYDLPKFFAMEDGKLAFGKTAHKDFMGTTIYSGADGHFAVKEKGSGVGTAFFSLFKRIVEQFAYEAGMPIVHRVTATHRSKSFFGSKCGYDEVQVTPGLRVDIHIMERTYQQHRHDLLANERQIVDSLMAVMREKLQPAVPAAVASAQ
ncbi:MAG: hypothetical protein AABX60_01020 [Nanoarchaeota archaeon]